ncbi:hypothetical protein CF326_g10008, partial [Tilletia indica]
MDDTPPQTPTVHHDAPPHTPVHHAPIRDLQLSPPGSDEESDDSYPTDEGTAGIPVGDEDEVDQSHVDSAVDGRPSSACPKDRLDVGSTAAAGPAAVCPITSYALRRAPRHSYKRRSSLYVETKGRSIKSVYGSGLYGPGRGRSASAESVPPPTPTLPVSGSNVPQPVPRQESKPSLTLTPPPALDASGSSPRKALTRAATRAIRASLP